MSLSLILSKSNILSNRSVVSAEQAIQQEWLAKKRVVVEQYFGRLKTVMGITRMRYPFQKDNMNMDIQICVWLTNQHILQHQLVEDDGLLYQRYINSLSVQVQAAKEEKRRINRCQTEKRRKLAESNSALIAAGCFE